MRQPRPLGLAVKITLPFVALFALVLLALGVVLAHEILAEVESEVERRQRFVLEVCSFRGLAFEEDMLIDIRDLSAGALPEAKTFGNEAVPAGNLIVIEAGGRKLTTFNRNDAATARIIDGLDAAIAKNPILSVESTTIHSRRLNLDGQDWMVLHTSRSTRAMKPVRRQFFLLYPFSEIEKAKNSALVRIIGLGSVGLLLAAGLGLLIAHWISRPVRRLAGAAQKISAGGLSEPLDSIDKSGTHSTDEIGDLSRAFQSMVESLRKSQDELLKAERLAVTGKLAASVAHEIRNPLTSLRMTVEMLQQRPGNSDPSIQDAYRIILSEIDRLALAVDELLTFARPRPPQRQPTDLNKLINDTLKFMERQMTHARVAAEAKLDAALPPELLLDPNKIRQLLVNLLLNAQQAIVRDGTITVSTQWDAGRGEICIRVADTGPGVPEEVREKLFDLFVTTKTGGGGMGLAIARQIVEEHAGTITYETSPTGTTFIVKLPAKVG